MLPSQQQGAAMRRTWRDRIGLFGCAAMMTLTGCTGTPTASERAASADVAAVSQRYRPGDAKPSLPTLTTTSPLSDYLRFAMLNSSSTERAPVSEALAAHMLARLRTKADLGKAAAFIARFSQLAATAPWRRFIFEVNPLLASADAAVALDGLLVIEASRPGVASP